MKEKNLTFTILSAIGIVLILLGHLDFNILALGGLFPYYSYHVMIFVFISGYFSKSRDEDDICGFFIRKSKHLLIPYFIWNVIYGIICMLLKYANIDIGSDITLYNLFVAPFMGGHQFGLNAPAWFVPALFLLQMCDILARKIWHLIIKKKDAVSEWMLMLLYLIVGMAVVALAKRGSVYDWYKLPGRLMLMAPAYQFGRLYRKDIEKRDRIPSVIYFSFLILINLILIYITGGLAYSTVWVTGFAGSVLTPFVTTFTGIALWLRISRILAQKINKDSYSFKAISAVSDHTFDIMMHHLLVFMMIKAVMYMAGCSMDIAAFKSDVYYVATVQNVEEFKWVYLILGIILPTVAASMIDKIKRIKK